MSYNVKDYAETSYIVFNNDDPSNCYDYHRDSLDDAIAVAKRLSARWPHDEIVIIKVTEVFKAHYRDGKEIDEKERK